MCTNGSKVLNVISLVGFWPTHNHLLILWWMEFKIHNQSCLHLYLLEVYKFFKANHMPKLNILYIDWVHTSWFVLSELVVLQLQIQCAKHMFTFLVLSKMLKISFFIIPQCNRPRGVHCTKLVRIHVSAHEGYLFGPCRITYTYNRHI
jgi:hypothetical protein